MMSLTTFHFFHIHENSEICERFLSFDVLRKKEFKNTFQSKPNPTLRCALKVARFCQLGYRHQKNNNVSLNVCRVFKLILSCFLLAHSK